MVNMGEKGEDVVRKREVMRGGGVKNTEEENG